MPAASAQLLHGLRLSGDVVVPGAHPSLGAPEFRVHVDVAREPDASRRTGQLVARGTASDDVATLEGDLLVAQFEHVGDYEIDLGSGRIVVYPSPGRGEAMVPIFLAGNIPALILGMRGASVLHASCVELDGATLAFAGATGAGKSTAAALACAAGAILVTDDAARVEERGDELIVHRGPGELRLRPQAAALAERVPGSVHTTPDERIAVRPPTTDAPTSALDGVILPRWRDDAREPHAAPVGHREALDRFLECPRVMGWRAAGPIRAHFVTAAAIAKRRPVFELSLPRGRITEPDLPAAMLDALAASGALGARGQAVR